MLDGVIVTVGNLNVEILTVLVLIQPNGPVPLTVKMVVPKVEVPKLITLPVKEDGLKV